MGLQRRLNHFISVTSTIIRNTPRAIIAKRRAATKAARRFVMRMSYMKAQRCFMPSTAVTQSPQQPPSGPALPAQALSANLAVYALAHLGDDLLVRLLDLFAGERVVVGTIRKRKGHGLLAHAHADRIAVDIEQTHTLE